MWLSLNIYLVAFVLHEQVKKIARRQTQDSGKGKKDGENGEKNKSKSPNLKKDDDSESDSSFVGNDSSLTGKGVNFLTESISEDHVWYYISQSVLCLISTHTH